jgi:hypothetical protein
MQTQLSKHVNLMAGCSILLVLWGLTLYPTPSHAGNLSKLNQQLQAKTRLFLPGRLYVGTTNMLTIQGKPGAKVILFVSPAQSGGAAPNGMALNVGDNNQSFTVKVAENGVASAPVTLPDALLGKTLFLDAVVYSAEDYGDMAHVDIMDSAGQPTLDNRITVVKLNEKGGKGASLMPALPGMNSQMLQQLQNTSQAQSDPRKKQLLYDGTRDNNRDLDRNSFIKLPGQTFTGAGAAP